MWSMYMCVFVCLWVLFSVTFELIDQFQPDLTEKEKSQR